jgi:aubergine
MLRNVKFERMGRNFYNPLRKVQVDKIEIWPGLFTSVENYSSGTLAQLELSYKCIRQDTLLQYM